MATPSSYALWNRQWSLVAFTDSNGLELSSSALVSSAPGGGTALRMQFQVRADDESTPNTAIIRVYNPNNATIAQVKEFKRVALQAGYQANYGQIFSGTIKQVRWGRENNVDRYMDIYAADGDIGYNFGVINTNFPARATYQDMLKQVAGSMGAEIDDHSLSLAATGGVLPRGKTAWGMGKVAMGVIAKNNNCRWSIQNGSLTLIPNDNFLPGPPVVMSSATGMLGSPEATENGITVRCYCNPAISVGGSIKIDNKLINQTLVKEQGMASWQAQYYPASTSLDGLYRVLVIEHTGDTRGNQWETELTCLHIDTSQVNVATNTGSPGSVLANG
jgi:hypothetical protein